MSEETQKDGLSQALGAVYRLALAAAKREKGEEMTDPTVITLADPGDCPDCGRPLEFCGCDENDALLAEFDALLAALLDEPLENAS